MSHNETAQLSQTQHATQALLAEGLLDEASQLLHQALANRESSELWNDWAVVQLALAERAFDRALKLDPWNPDALVNMGMLLFGLVRLEAAESFLREALDSAVGTTRAHLETLLRAYAPPTPPPRKILGAAGENAMAPPLLPAENTSAAPKRKEVVEGDVDLIVQEAFFPDPLYRGTMIEVGAAKPDYLSVSATFRSRGWRVLSIEPNPYFCDLQRQQGVNVIECACGSSDNDDASFFVVQTDATYQGQPVTNESFSSLGVRGKYADMMKSVPTAVTEIKVKVRRLDTILREHASDLREIDILCVDVEGWELEVLCGLSFDVYKPRVLIVENLFLDPTYVDYFAQKNYALWKRLEPNDIYIRSDLRTAELLADFRANQR
ncbi:MAG: FkbM family methyltransferase [Candidatus Acidiferrales bacterium]